MNNRLELHELLCSILESRNVYFQPPETIKMKYPAIVYSINSIDNKHGDNRSYIRNNSYTITLIDKNPDNEFVNKIADLKECRFIRSYQAENLNHYIFVLYY